MNNVLHAARLLLLDMASTVFFLVIYLLSGELVLAVVLSIVLGLAQIGWEIARRRPVDTLQWASLVIVVAAAVSALVMHDVRFIILKLSAIYAAVGVVMLKRGWLNRYQPPVALAMAPDVVAAFGFVWSGLMFFSAALNVIVAFGFGVAAWAWVMPLFGIASKSGLFVVQYGVTRLVVKRRQRNAQVAGSIVNAWAA